MSLDIIFPDIQVSENDATELHRILGEPLIRRYLIGLATSSTKELIALSLLNKSDAETVKIHAKVQGRIETINTLLAI